MVRCGPGARTSPPASRRPRSWRSRWSRGRECGCSGEPARASVAGVPRYNDTRTSRMAQLKIGSSRDAALVMAADMLLWPIGLTRRVWRRRPGAPPRQVLCLRLERLGDLIMTLPALAELRSRTPAAAIDLVVGRWNEELARTI